ncbi:MAG: peptidase domain-containing ABC transporter [Novosphingobium sp.]|nr:peptidase domain-containing ABC transporter [Novosphingobium sp.]
MEERNNNLLISTVQLLKINHPNVEFEFEKKEYENPNISVCETNKIINNYEYSLKEAKINIKKLKNCSKAFIIKKRNKYYTVIKVNKYYITILNKNTKQKEKYLLKNIFTQNEQINCLFLVSLNFRRYNRIIKKNPFLFIIYYLVPHKKIVLELIISALLATVFTLGGSFYFKILIDDIIVTNSTNSLVAISFAYGCAILFRIILEGYRVLLSLLISVNMQNNMISDYFIKVLGLPLSIIPEWKHGQLIERITDILKVQGIIFSNVIPSIIDIIMIITSIIIISLQAPKVSIFILIFIPLYWVIAVIFQKKFRKYHSKTMEAHGNATSFIVEMLRGIVVIKSFNLERIFSAKVKNKFSEVFNNNFINNSFGVASDALVKILSIGGSALVLAFGGFLVIHNNISIGQLLTIYTLTGFVVQPLQRISYLNKDIQEANVAAERVLSIMKSESEEDLEGNKNKINSFDNLISIKNLDFYYNSKKRVLENISLNIKKGEFIGIVGESGSGKSTLMKLLMKYYIPSSGDIFIDDNNLSNIDVFSYRKIISYIPQDLFIINSSIKENIIFYNEGDKNYDINAVIKDACLEDVILNNTNGLNTKLQEFGNNLSGGEKQRISIARALYKNAPILFFDEATSALDITTEKKVKQSILKLRKHKTIVMISHRLTTVMDADKIIVLDNGKIVEMGKHKELLNNNSLYNQLWNDQFSTNE